MTRAGRLAALLAGAAVALAGCGGDSGGDEGSSTRLVDLSKKPPYVNALDIDPGSGDFLLTTNRGFFRIDPDEDRATRLRATISAKGKSSPVGTFLLVTVTGPRTLIGSGHPDKQGTLPSFLGFIRSDDRGRTWRVVSRLGAADLHKIVLRHDRMYAFDAVLSAIVISHDEGRTFSEHFTPRGLIIDFEVDPDDPKRLVASNDDELFRSEDEGDSWRPIVAAPGIRLAWPAPNALYRADKDGTIRLSNDGGDTWEDVGRVDGEPYKFKVVDEQHLYLALSDGSIVETTDGGRSWEAVFEP
jgi:photosystem II stability/assembly factor-like uncharacterized protein